MKKFGHNKFTKTLSALIPRYKTICLLKQGNEELGGTPHLLWLKKHHCFVTQFLSYLSQMLVRLTERMLSFDKKRSKLCRDARSNSHEIRQTRFINFTFLLFHFYKFKIGRNFSSFLKSLSFRKTVFYSPRCSSMHSTHSSSTHLVLYPSRAYFIFRLSLLPGSSSYLHF